MIILLRYARLHALGLTQVINWGILFYGLSVTAKPMSQTLNLSLTQIYFGLTLSLLVGGLASPLLGKWIDHYGARSMMCLGTLIASLACLLVGLTQNLTLYLIAAVLSGFASRLCLYDAAFALLVHSFKGEARLKISFITLWGALASSFIWPLGAWLLNQTTWQGVFIGYAGLLLFISLPLHYFLSPHAKPVLDFERPREVIGSVTSQNNVKASNLFTLAITFTGFVSSALAVHLILFLEGVGLVAALAIFIASLKGIAQLLGRLLEMLYGQKLSPLSVSLIASLCMALSFIVLLTAQTQTAAFIFALFYGIGQGLMTVARGTVPLFLFGSKGYAAVMGKIARPHLILSAFAPLIFMIFYESFGASLLIYALLCLMLLAFACLYRLKKYI